LGGETCGLAVPLLAAMLAGAGMVRLSGMSTVVDER